MISTLFVSGALYLIFRDTSQKEQAAYSLENLSQLDSSAERIYESLSPAINNILASGYASSFMERKDLGRLEEFRLLENLNRPVSWKAPHVKGDGKKTWAEIATSTGADDASKE